MPLMPLPSPPLSSSRPSTVALRAASAAVPAPAATSVRTGPWPPPEPAPFAVPGCEHVLLSPLPGAPEIACGADDADVAAAAGRCHGEAVERLTAWRHDPLPAPLRGAPHLRAACFAQDGVLPIPSGIATTVEELTDLDSVSGLVTVDRAAVGLGGPGWFPAGSTGLAAAVGHRAAIAAGAWEVLERDLLTAWWRDRTPAAALPAASDTRSLAVSAELGARGIALHALAIGPGCILVAAVDDARELVAVGTSAGPDPDRRRRKATQEALISLAQLTALLPSAGDRRLLDRPAAEDRSLAGTLRLLLDPRFAAEIRARVDAARPADRSAARSAGYAVVDPDLEDGPVGEDPVRLLRERGRRVLAVELRSPESRWAGLTVMRVLAPGARTPLPRSVRPTELPVPLA
ncbi:YcaO-like family protein [Brachybacterium sp. DNPG3]